MFAQLPDEIQQKVLHFLQDDDFPAAKKLYDQWRALDCKWDILVDDDAQRYFPAD